MQVRFRWSDLRLNISFLLSKSNKNYLLEDFGNCYLPKIYNPETLRANIYFDEYWTKYKKVRTEKMKKHNIQSDWNGKLFRKLALNCIQVGIHLFWDMKISVFDICNFVKTAVSLILLSYFTHFGFIYENFFWQFQQSSNFFILGIWNNFTHSSQLCTCTECNYQTVIGKSPKPKAEHEHELSIVIKLLRLL